MRVLSTFSLLFQGIARVALRLREAEWLRIFENDPDSTELVGNETPRIALRAKNAVPKRTPGLETNSAAAHDAPYIDAEYRFAAENGFNPLSLLDRR